jgi:hypothetical protein
MLIDSIWDWNPWWNDIETIKVLSGRMREETEQVLPTLNENNITILSGIRRSGKTTIMYQLIQDLLEKNDPRNILFLGLEDPSFQDIDIDKLLSEYRTEMDPKGKTYIFLDEVQTKEGWERIIRRENDIHRDQKIVVTGSSSGLISGNYATLLTGRNLTFHIHPLSFRNYISFKTREQFFFSGTRGKERLNFLSRNYLDEGGFPEVVLQPEELHKSTLNQYFNDIIHRDIIDQYSVDPRKIMSLSGFLMLNIGKVVTLSSLRRSVGLSYDAIRDYLIYLRRSGLFYLMPEFSFSDKPALKDSGKQKIYSADLGMARYIQGRHSRDYGRFAENAVFLDLVHREFDPGFIQRGKEIDFVISTPEKVSLINVSYGDRIPDREYDGFKETIESYPKVNFEPILITKSLEGSVNGIDHRPLSQWLYRE